MALRRLGDILLEAGLVDRAKLQAALDRRKTTGERLGQALISLGYLREDAIAKTLADQLGLRYLAGPEQAPATVPASDISESAARRFRGVPLGRQDGQLMVAVSDPLNTFALEQLAYMTDRSILPVVCTEQTMDQLLEQYYPRHGHRSPHSASDRLRGTMSRLAAQGSHGTTSSQGLASGRLLLPASPDRSGGSVVDWLVRRCLSLAANEIHLEMTGTQGRARARRGHALQDLLTLPSDLYLSVLAYVRSQSGLDLTDIGGEGWFELQDDDIEISVRVTYLHMPGADRAVLRLVNRQRQAQSFESLGLTGNELAAFRGLLRSEHGLVVISSLDEAPLRDLMRATASALNDPSKLVALLDHSPTSVIRGIMHIVFGSGRELDATAALRAATAQDADVILLNDSWTAHGIGDALTRALLAGKLVIVGCRTLNVDHAIDLLTLAGVTREYLSRVLRGGLEHRYVRRHTLQETHQGASGTGVPQVSDPDLCGETESDSSTSAYHVAQVQTQDANVILV